MSEPDEVIDYDEQSRSAKVTLGFAGFGVGSESTIWLSTLEPGWATFSTLTPN